MTRQQFEDGVSAAVAARKGLAPLNIFALLPGPIRWFSSSVNTRGVCIGSTNAPRWRHEGGLYDEGGIIVTSGETLYYFPYASIEGLVFCANQLLLV